MPVYVYCYVQENMFPDRPRRAISMQFRNIRANQEKVIKPYKPYIYLLEEVCVFYIYEKVSECSGWSCCYFLWFSLMKPMQVRKDMFESF